MTIPNQTSSSHKIPVRALILEQSLTRETLQMKVRRKILAKHQI